MHIFLNSVYALSSMFTTHRRREVKNGNRYTATWCNGLTAQTKIDLKPGGFTDTTRNSNKTERITPRQTFLSIIYMSCLCFRQGFYSRRAAFHTSSVLRKSVCACVCARALVHLLMCTCHKSSDIGG